MAKKALDSISKGANTEGEATEPVVETITPHTEPSNEPIPTATEQAAPVPAASLESTASAATAIPVATTPSTSDANGIPVATPTASTTPPGTATPPNEFESLFPEPGTALSAPPSWVWWVVLLVVSLIIGGVGYAIAKNKINTWLAVATPSPTALVSQSPTVSPTTKTTATPSPTPTPTSTPTATATPNSLITIRVLNGTTQSGLASTVKTMLTKAGFTVRTIGNAATQNYTATMIYYQTGKLDAAKAVQNALTGYTATLQESAQANPDNVLVILGKK